MFHTLEVHKLNLRENIHQISGSLFALLAKQVATLALLQFVDHAQHLAAIVCRPALAHLVRRRRH